MEIAVSWKHYFLLVVAQNFLETLFSVRSSRKTMSKKNSDAACGDLFPTLGQP
jgi:hypothetical protein